MFFSRAIPAFFLRFLTMAWGDKTVWTLDFTGYSTITISMHAFDQLISFNNLRIELVCTFETITVVP